MIYTLAGRKEQEESIKVNTARSQHVGGWYSPTQSIREDLYVSNKKKKGKVYFLVKTNTEKKDMNGEVETKADRLGFYDAKKWLSQRSVESPLAKEIFFDHQAV